jgi:hypothetical protein
MGPSALFDKSFLQSLSVDESVWFGHFFSPNVCPLFYVETLADLEKRVRPGRTPEQEVGIIAAKFPENSAVPNVYHMELGVHELLGNRITMDGRPIVPGGRVVNHKGERGVVYDESQEARAFSRWQDGEFLEVERDSAKAWRSTLAAINLQSIAKDLRELGVNAGNCRTLVDARSLANSVVLRRDKPFAVIALAIFFFNIPREYHVKIVERWSIAGYPELERYAPYVAHVLKVELFFQFSLAAHLIGAERSSNRVDIAYLNYLPFCNVFISGDDLHRRCAPLFLRENQEFIWAQDLKGDLDRINAHFSRYPNEEKERGITAFAHAPPNLDGSIVHALHAKFMWLGTGDKRKATPSNNTSDQKLAEKLSAWRDAPTAESQALISEEIRMLSLERNVRRKKGSWWQLPKNLKPEKPKSQ